MKATVVRSFDAPPRYEDFDLQRRRCRCPGRQGFIHAYEVAHRTAITQTGRERMLTWAAATFNALGPANARAAAPAAELAGMIRFATGVGRNGLRPAGWAARLFDAADACALDAGALAGLLVDNIAPSLDTTILGAGHDGVAIPEGERVLRARPRRLRPRRAPRHLAQLEFGSLLLALVARVRCIEAFEPQLLLNNVLHGNASFHASFA